MTFVGLSSQNSSVSYHLIIFRFPGTQTEVINVGSYNYLGFAQNEGPCAEAAVSAIDSDGLSLCGSALEVGKLSIFQFLFFFVVN